MTAAGQDVDIELLFKIAEGVQGLTQAERHELGLPDDAEAAGALVRSIAAELVHLRKVSARHYGDAGVEARAMAALQERVAAQLELRDKHVPLDANVDWNLISAYAVAAQIKAFRSQTMISNGLGALGSFLGEVAKKDSKTRGAKKRK